jgi:hypothetical protein
MRRLLLLASLLLAIPLAAHAQSAAVPSGYSIAVLSAPSPPPIDGNVDSPAWANAPKVQLLHDLRNGGAADQPTTVYVERDANYLYIGVDAKQRASIEATQHTNDVGQGTDDTFSVYLWPDGPSGIEYQFSSNPIGTHYQFSSENTAYAPAWQSVGRIVPGGYQITMRIPLSAIRAGSGTDWRVQFQRTVLLTLDDYVWAYSPAMSGPGNPVYAGHLTGIQTRRALRPQPRFGLYALGQSGSNTLGDATSRMGLDASIPFTATSSFVATIHPDYSNVEQDQQTIAPTAYQRYYSEVRPFFTQLQNFYDPFNCIGCPGVNELYTPAIPTPRDGFAVEGHQGPISYASFDSIGDQRNDTATAVTYQTEDQKFNVSGQQVTASGINADACGPGISAADCYGLTPGTSLSDRLTTFGATYNDQRGLFEYFTYGADRGTLVTNDAQAQRYDGGIGTYNKNGFAGIAVRKIGAYYNPVDGFVQQNDLAGFDANADNTWYLNPKGVITRVIGFVNYDRYTNARGQEDLFDDQAAIGITFGQRTHVRLQTGSDYTLLPDGNFVPINQNGINLLLNYHTSSPISFSYFTGRFGPGRVDAWTRSATIAVTPRSSLTFEADNDVQWLDAGGRNMLWLERASYALQAGKNSSFAVGVRRILGADPQLENGPLQSGLNAWNVSAAFYKRLPHDELYLVYGDASALYTKPALILKLIHYFGAEKGT